MKKLVSILLVFCLVISFSVTAFASETPSFEDVSAELETTLAYLLEADGVSAYTVDDAVDFYYYTFLGENADSYFDAFLQDVKDNLAANNGKIVPSFGENMTTYAAVMGILDACGEDVEDVNGVDLTELLANADPATITNPYYYNIVIPMLAFIGDDELTASICDDFIENNYTMGSGMNYWGYSCDNTAMFISAVSQSGMDDYAPVLQDAMQVLETYKTEGGYCYNPDYGTEANIDSTALALMAKSAYFINIGEPTEEDDAALADLYEEMLGFKGTTEGSYLYAGAESVYGTKDALKALNMYDLYLIFNEYQDVDDEDISDIELPTLDFDDIWNFDDIRDFFDGLFAGSEDEETTTKPTDDETPTEPNDDETPVEIEDEDIPNEDIETPADENNEADSEDVVDKDVADNDVVDNDTADNSKVDVEIPNTGSNTAVAVFGVMAVSAVAFVSTLKKKED